MHCQLALVILHTGKDTVAIHSMSLWLVEQRCIQRGALANEGNPHHIFS